jgi:DNA-binding beta-propeller fold protein YncE
MRNTFVLALALPAALLPSLALGQTPSTLELKSRIPLANVQGRIDHTSVDLMGQRLFVAAFDNKTLEVIDVQAGKQVHTIANLNQPQQTYFDAPTNHLFVSSSGDGTVKVFDGTTFALLQTTQLASDADNMRFDGTHGHLVVAYGGEKFLNGQVARGAGLKDGALAILDTAGKVLGQIPTDGHPESLAVVKSGARVFTNVPDKKEIVVGDLATYKVLAHWPLPGCENYPMAFDEDHHRVFIMCRAAGNVTALDSDSGEPVAVIPLTPSATSDDMFYDASKGRIYVLSSITQKGNTVGQGLIEVLQQRDPDHYERIETNPIGLGVAYRTVCTGMEQAFRTVAERRGGQRRIPRLRD